MIWRWPGRKSAAWVLIGTLGLIVPERGARGADPFPAWTSFEVSPALSSAVDKAGLTWMKQALGQRTELRVGDRVVMLLELTEKKQRLQWVVEVTVVEPVAGAPATKSGMRVFTSTGRAFDFAGSRVALSVRIVGPVDAAGRDPAKAARRAKDVVSRLGVNESFLKIGFARQAKVVVRMKERSAEKEASAPGRYSISTKPFEAEAVEAGREIAAYFEIDQTDERALAGWMPSLLEFFGVIMRTEGLREIFREVVDVPWWAILSGGGKLPDINFETVPTRARLLRSGTSDDGTVRDEVWAVPFRLDLNGKPALWCELAAVEPMAPVTAVAGVVGLVAAPPDGGKALRMVVLAMMPAEENSGGEGGGKQ